MGSQRYSESINFFGDSGLLIDKQGLYAGVSIPLIGVTPMCILPLYRLTLDLVNTTRCCFLLGL